MNWEWGRGQGAVEVWRQRIKSEIVSSLPGKWARSLMRQIDSTVCQGGELTLKRVITGLKKDHAQLLECSWLGRTMVYLPDRWGPRRERGTKKWVWSQIQNQLKMWELRTWRSGGARKIGRCNGWHRATPKQNGLNVITHGGQRSVKMASAGPSSPRVTVSLIILLTCSKGPKSPLV